jgi:hypothetical protein
MLKHQFANIVVEVKEMPYIKPEDRPKYDKVLTEIIEMLKAQPVERVDGELNYCVTRILKGVYPPKYFNYNRAVGVLECIKLEFYRRMVGPYEDIKIKESGDV